MSLSEMVRKLTEHHLVICKPASKGINELSLSGNSFNEALAARVIFSYIFVFQSQIQPLYANMAT